MRIKTLLILYHDIRNDSFKINSSIGELLPYILKESNFVEQMKWLYENSYSTILVKDAIEGNFSFEDKKVNIVLDDGWRSNYEIVFPILKGFGFKATFFVTIKNIGKPGMMTWEQVRDLADNNMEIGSHNMTHRFPTELSDKEIGWELKESKKILEKKIDKSIYSFSSPTGFFDARISKLAKSIGYKAVCFTKFEISYIDLTDQTFLVLNKIGIKRGCSIVNFGKIVLNDSNYFFIQRMKQKVRDFVKKILGPKNYINIKSFLLKKTS